MRWRRPALRAEVVDHGPQIFALTVREARVAPWGEDPDAALVAYAVSEGIPAQLSVTTLEQPSRLLARVPLPGAHGARGLGWASDGALWIGTQPQGRIFRWRPGESEATEVGRPTGRAEFVFGVAAASDGRMFVGTYPDACVVEHHPTRGFTRVHRVRGAQYVRALALDESRDLLWVASSAPHQLSVIDLGSGRVRAVELDPPLADCPDDLTVTALGVAFSAGLALRLVDADTLTERALHDEHGALLDQCWMGSRGLSPARDGQHWFTGRLGSTPAGRQRLQRLDPRTGVVTATQAVVAGAAIGWGERDDVLAAVVGNYGGQAMSYDTAAGALTELTLAVPAGATRLHQLTATGHGDELLVGAYLNPTAVRVSPPGEPAPFAQAGQVEAFAVSGDTVVLGSYPDAAIVALSRSGSVPARELARLKPEHYQARAWALLTDGDQVHAATCPAPGHRGGVIARLGLDEGAPTLVAPVPVPGHCVATLARVGTRLFAGTSRRAGEGLDPSSGRAELLELDPDTLALRRAHRVPGWRPGSVSALLESQGRLYGLADAVLFELDPDGGRVHRRRKLPGVRAGVNDASALLRHPDGRLYAVCGQRLFVIEPRGWRVRRVALPAPIARLAMTADGALWWLTLDGGVPSRLGSWRPLDRPTGGAAQNVR